MRAISLCVPAAVIALNAACASSSSSSSHAATEPPPLTYDEQLAGIAARIESGHLREAELAAAEAARAQPDRPEAYALWGRALARENALGAAVGKYEAARAHGSRDAALFAELASTYDVLKAYREAEGVYRDYLADHPQDAAMRDELAITLLLDGQTEAAVKEAKAAHEAAPHDTQIAQDLGYALLRAKQFAAARGILEDTIASDPERQEGRRYLAEAWAGLGELDKARAALGQVLAKDPNDTLSRTARARIEAVQGAFSQALDDYTKLADQLPKDGAVELGRAGALIALNRLEEAQASIDRARQSLGEHAQVLFRQAQIDWRRGHKEALAAIEAATEQAANAREAWDELARAAKKFADKALQQRVKKHP